MASTEIVPANDILFSDFCKVLQKLYERKKQKPEQEKILFKFINDFRIHVAKISGEKNTSFFPVLRLLLPDKERDRAAYNLKEATLGALLVKVLSLNKHSRDGEKLRNFRSVAGTQDGDFAGVAYFVLKNRVGQNSRPLTIGDINAILDKIAAAEAGNKGPIRDEAFSYVLKNLSPDQVKWFLRIVLKDLKLGLGSKRILAAFHPDAPALFESCSSLSKVCEELDSGDTRPLELGIRLFYAVSPMLSEPLDVKRAAQELAPGKTYQIENKFDGERFQMHMENGVFEYYSRKGFSYSQNYGKSYDSGLLTPLLKGCFSPSVSSFVLDGEMMGWHKQHKCLGSKGMAFDVKKVTANSKFQPCYCVFDILYYNGKSLVGPKENGGLPLTKRLEILRTMFSDVPGVIMHSKAKITNNESYIEDILNALNKAIEDQEEGIVVKDVESYYIANKRNAGWYKIKPEYTENTMSDLDLVIIGADEAENKRQGRAKSFHVACADVADSGDAPHRWVSVGRVATGFTFEEREKVCLALEKHWVSWKKTPAPHYLVFNKETPDYWIKPEHSIVLQVRASELIRSTDFGTDYTLRFPRIISIRDDKPVNNVMTLNEFNKLVAEKLPVIKLTNNKLIKQDEMAEVELKTRRKRTAAVLKVAETFRTRPRGDVEVTSLALAGRKLCVLSDDEDCKKPELVRIVESHSGKHVENIGPDTWCCIVGQQTYRTRSLIQAQNLDITTTAWLRSLPQSDTPCSLSPLDMLSMKTTTKLKLSLDYDQFGDSYKQEIDENTLKRIFNKMEVDNQEIYLTNDEMIDIDKMLFEDYNPFSYFRRFYLHFEDSTGSTFYEHYVALNKSGKNTNKITLLEIKAQMYGAHLCNIQAPKLTHVICKERKSLDVLRSVIEEFRRKNVYLNSEVFIVSIDWLKACFEQERAVPETEFLLQIV